VVDFDDADGAACSDTPDAPMLRRSEVVRVHAAAEGFLASQRGPAWADAPGMDCVARLLAEARAHALGSEAAWRSPGLRTAVPRDDEPDFAAALLYASVRSNSAERELAAMLASHSWKVTAPLRWIHQRLGQAV
jgi:hypothetical protein